MKPEVESQHLRDRAVQLESELKEQQSLLRRLRLLELAIQETNTSVLITTSQLNPPGPEIVYVNAGFTKMTGYAWDEVIGKTPRILQGPKTDRSVLDRLRRSLSSGKDFVGEMINYHKDGSEFHVEWRVASMRAADGEIRHFVAVQNDITDIKLAEVDTKTALLESEARYRELFENANDLVFTVDLEGKFTSLNKTIEEVTGFTRDEIVGADLSILVPPKHADKAREMIRRKIATRKSTTYEIEILAKSGCYIPIEVASRLTYENGEPTGIQGIARDITERKRSEEDLRLAAAAFQTHESMFITDEQGKILRVNERFTELTGYTAAEALGQNPRILKSRRHDREFYRRMWAVIVDKGFWEGEVWNRRKNGEIFPQRLTITAVKDESNETSHFVAVAQDISDRKRAEEKIRDLSRFPAENPSPVFRVQRDGAIVYANDASQPLLNLWNCRSGERLPADWCQVIRDVLNSQCRKEAEVQVGDEVLSLTFAPVAEADCVNVYGHDITDRKCAERELIASNLELQQMNYAASHDLLEPLRTIVSFSQLLVRQYCDRVDDDGQSTLDAIVEAGKRMKALIQDLRVFSQLDTQTRAFEPVCMKEVFVGAVANVHSSVQELKAEVAGGDLPIVMGDMPQLTQLFQHLIGNALKYRANDPPRVQISAEDTVDAWVFSVRDNGIGIDPQHHEKIFDVFRRLHHQAEYPGTGIGLSICRRIIEKHHGKIWVESEPGCGSTFRFTLPNVKLERSP